MSPSIAAMLLFIAVPIISIALQSLHSEPDKVVEVIETCGPFGCTETTLVTDAAGRCGRFFRRLFGLSNYTNRNHLALSRCRFSVGSRESSEVRRRVLNLPFYRAMTFTLTYTFCVTPLVLLFWPARRRWP